MNNMEIYEKYRSVPENAKKTIGAGRTKGFTDINPMWRIKCLTEQFGACGIGWYIKTTNRWTEAVGDEIAAFVEIELYVKTNGEWSAPIFGTGGSKLSTKEKGGVYVSDECYKMATTDAISVACKMLGIGADVYWAKDLTKYNVEQSNNQSAISAEEMERNLNAEVMRIGWNMGGLLAWLKVRNAREIPLDKYEYAMQSMKKKPDKIPDIPDDDEGLPFR